MEQPTPIVTQADVERIVRRDYPKDKYADIISVLDEYGVCEWHRETNRVKVAVLKLANGNNEVSPDFEKRIEDNTNE